MNEETNINEHSGDQENTTGINPEIEGNRMRETKRKVVEVDTENRDSEMKDDTAKSG